MSLTIPPNTKAKLEFASLDGLDVVYVAIIYFGGGVGTRYYSTRPIPLMTSVPWEDKMLEIPQVQKRTDPSSLRFDALNDDLTIRLRNTPEREDGHYDEIIDFVTGGRIQDLMTETALAGARVEVGMADLRGLNALNQIKWDGVYKVDRVDRNNKEVSIYCVDRLLYPGEKLIGQTVNNQDWPLAPEQSYSAVRGPVFGKVDGLPLVPVEVGLFATLANEIDDQDGIIDLAGEQISLWPNSGYVEIGDEVIYYPVIDKTNKRLGSSVSRCSRGVGFPKTTPAMHADYAVAREVYTGREAALNGALTASSTVINLRSTPYPMPPAGVIVIDSEAIFYTTKNGNALSGLVRGVAVPTIAKVHGIGSSVRTFPVGPDGNPRYRYLVAEGTVAGVANLRVQDEQGNDLPYTGGASTLSQVSLNGRTWSVVDLPARPRFERFEESSSQVPEEWIFATDGTVDSEGIATNVSFLRWFSTIYISQAHVFTWPRAIDPNASTRAVILESTAGKNIFSIQFNAKWDEGLNHPRRRYGRFRNARLRVRVQYDRKTETLANYQVHSNHELVKSGVFPPPTEGGPGDGTIFGQQELPKSRWDTQKQTRDIRLSSRTTNQYADGLNGNWVDPIKVWFGSGGVVSGGGNADHSAAFDGDTRTFLSGSWNFTSGEPNTNRQGGYSAPLNLYSNGQFPEPSSRDKLTALVVTMYNPVGYNDFWTGWKGTISLYPAADFTGTARTHRIEIGKHDGTKIARIPLNDMTWAQLQSLKLTIDQYNTVGLSVYGATVGEVQIAVEYEADVEGQREGTIVDGSYFRSTATTTPGAVYDQTVSLGAIAKDWGRRNDRDPWDFFSAVVTAEGMRLSVMLPTAGDGLRFAVADVELELEYEALNVVYDGLMIADVDGVVGAPVSGGPPVVLEDPVDILAYLVDQEQFLDLAGDRDGASWTAARAVTAGLIGWKVARAIVETTAVRDLVASLCAESRLLLLADGLKLYTRFRMEEATPAESVRLVGDQIEPAFAVVKDDIQIVQRLEDIYNSIGCYYRRNYVTGAFKAVMEETDEESIRVYGKRRATPNLEWHQSDRGYAAGLPEQQTKLNWLTKYLIEVSARIWDYATVELAASAAEDLQRYDVLTINYPRSNYYSTPGRVVAVQRLQGPMRFAVTVQMNPSTLGYIWQSEDDPNTYIKLAEAAKRMDFVIQGVLQAQLTSAGHFRCRGDFNVSGTSTIESVKNTGGGTAIHLYRERRDGAFNGQFERLLTVSNFGVVTIYAYNNGTTTETRDVSTPASILNIGGVAGIVDTIAPSQTGRLEFYLANRLVMYIDSVGVIKLGSIRANLGTRMGSVQ